MEEFKIPLYKQDTGDEIVRPEKPNNESERKILPLEKDTNCGEIQEEETKKSI